MRYMHNVKSRPRFLDVLGAEVEKADLDDDDDVDRIMKVTTVMLVGVA